MTETWRELSCTVPADLAETAADYISSISGSGVCTENRAVDAFSHSDIPELTEITIKGYFDASIDESSYLPLVEEFLRGLAAERGSIFHPPKLELIASEEWENSWKEYFKPLRVGKKLVIVPTWEEYHRQDDDLVIQIDPGMAFGTGGHETTRLCMEMLEEIIEDSPSFHSPSMLDLGTGSGILAIAAAMLGAGEIWGVDIDPQAVAVAIENAELNSLDDMIRLDTTPLEAIDKKFDIIAANILAEELVRLSGELASRMAAGGWLILSGILAEKENFVISGFADTHLEHIKSRKAGEWVALLYRKGCP